MKVLDDISAQSTQPSTKQQPTPKNHLQITQLTKDKVDAAKSFIEQKYSHFKVTEAEKKLNWELLFSKMDSMNLTKAEKELIRYDILHNEALNLRKKFYSKRQKLSIKSFNSIAIIGKGAFGEVRLCRNKETKEVVAIKKMKKTDMIAKSQIGHVRAERDVLVLGAQNNPWIVDLKCSFQVIKNLQKLLKDENYLYLVMDYLQGGDLMTLLMVKDILSEEEAKFYIAECILAVDSVHKMNYIHRDLKPDNILIGKDGHIKLSDFGLCKYAEIKPKIQFGNKIQQEEKIQLEKPSFKKVNNFRRNRKLAYSTVGTPDYIAPEVFSQQGYTEVVDWWSLGVILFEMLVGYPPFFSDDPPQTCQKIMQWHKYFAVPSDANLSSAAIDLIQKLIADQSERLGINGVEEIKVHPFFFGVDWRNIRSKKAFNIPQLKGDDDHSKFDKFEEEEPWIVNENTKNNKRNRNVDVNFIGYTFKQDMEQEWSQLVVARENLEQTLKNNQQQLFNNFSSKQLGLKQQSPSSQQITSFIPQKQTNSDFENIIKNPENNKNSSKLSQKEFHKNEKSPPSQQGQQLGGIKIPTQFLRQHSPPAGTPNPNQITSNNNSNSNNNNTNNNNNKLIFTANQFANGINKQTNQKMENSGSQKNNLNLGHQLQMYQLKIQQYNVQAQKGNGSPQQSGSPRTNINSNLKQLVTNKFPQKAANQSPAQTNFFKQPNTNLVRNDLNQGNKQSPTNQPNQNQNTFNKFFQTTLNKFQKDNNTKNGMTFLESLGFSQLKSTTNEPHDKQSKNTLKSNKFGK